MLDIGWSEMLLIAVIAIIVIGPKDLPKALRTVGQWVGRARSIAREFQSSVDQMIADAELDEIKKTANSVADFKPDTYLQNQIDPTGPTSDTPAEPMPTADAETVATGGGAQSSGSAATVAPPAPALEDGAYHPPAETVEADAAGEPAAAETPRARAGET